MTASISRPTPTMIAIGFNPPARGARPASSPGSLSPDGGPSATGDGSTGAEPTPPPVTCAAPSVARGPSPVARRPSSAADSIGLAIAVSTPYRAPGSELRGAPGQPRPDHALLGTPCSALGTRRANTGLVPP